MRVMLKQDVTLTDGRTLAAGTHDLAPSLVARLDRAAYEVAAIEAPPADRMMRARRRGAKDEGRRTR